MSKIDLVVLGFLKRKPMHGYEMAGFFEKRGIDMWIKIKTPSIYKALNRLKEKELVSYKFLQSENSPSRKVYSITKSGEEYFNELLHSILIDDKIISPFDFWNALRFAQDNLTKNQFITIINTRLEIIAKKEQELMAKHNKAELDGKLNSIPFYGKTVMESFVEIKKITKDALIKIKEEAALPENENVFKKENE
ncbi:MAG: PadR family transcriptional regulator [Candidatus Cloacimonetes bacterium]|nr:PadR family transcriptional regulator [Candidatus Cloacimonadota bacterium]